MSETTQPVLMVVDDDPTVLEILQHQLSEHYGDHYQVEVASASEDALDRLVRYKLHDKPLALLIADCDLGQDSGTELLERVGELFPRARRVLIAGHEERENVTRAMKRLALDQYLLKPLHDPNLDLFPVLDDLLQDWQAVSPSSNHTSPTALRIVGYRWSPDAHRIKDFLARNLVPYRWLEYERPEATSLVQAAGLDSHSLPVVFFPDGTQLVRPNIEDLAERVGLQRQAEARFYDLVIVGGGPAGLSAAVYGASEGLDVLLIEAEAPGGQAGASARIDNYLGFPSGLSGTELTRRAVTQAQRFGVEILTPQRATGIQLKGHYRLVELGNGTKVACYVALICTGVSYRRLEIPGMDRLTGAGVYYGAVITEAISCQNREVFILGGGNSAGQAAMYLSRFASSITILTNTNSLNDTMSLYLIDQIRAAGNIHVRTRSTISALHGQDHLEALTVLDEQTGQEDTVPAAALFIYIGAQPRTDWLGDELARDEQGYLLTGPDLVEARQTERFQVLGREPLFLESSVPGVFAAGDTRFGSVKRIASSVGEGAMAITLIHQYLAAL